MSLDRRAYASDVSDEEWALVAPYLALLWESSGLRDHELREVFNGLRFIVKTGAPWRFMPHDLPPWAAVYQQTQRWLAAECFTDVSGDLRAVLRMAGDREPEPSAVILDRRTLRSSPESGSGRARAARIDRRQSQHAPCLSGITGAPGQGAQTGSVKIRLQRYGSSHDILLGLQTRRQNHPSAADATPQVPLTEGWYNSMKIRDKH